MSNLLRITNKIETLGIWDSIPSDSINSVVIEFEFAEDWENLLCVAQFTQGENTYNVVIENNRCVLPTELKIGNVMLSVFGTKTDGTPFRETSIPFCFEIYDAGFSSTAETPIPPTPDLYEQLIDKFAHSSGVAALNGKTGEVDIVADEGISVDDTETGKIKIKSTATITVDSEISETSENPVQNKVIYENLMYLIEELNSSISALQAQIDENHPYENGNRLFYTKTTEEVKAITISSKGEPWKLKEFYLGIYIPASPELNSLDYIQTSVLSQRTSKYKFTGRTVITGGTLGKFHRYIVFAHTGNGFWRFNSGISLDTEKPKQLVALNCTPDGMGIVTGVHNSSEKELRAKEITISTTSTTATFPIGTEIEVYGI